MRLFPIQTHHTTSRGTGRVPETVYMAAYRVYAHIHGEQRAMIDLEGRNCRGGFSTAELVAFLYAASFPKEQWAQKVDEAFEGIAV